MVNYTYSQQNKERLNRARLASDFERIQSGIEKARSFSQKSPQKAGKAVAMWKKGDKGAAMGEMALLAQEINDLYDITNKNVEMARMQATTQRTAEAFVKFGKVAEKELVLQGVWEAVQLAHFYRERIKEHDNTPFFFLIIIAIMSDFMIIPFLDIPFKIIIIYTLWGMGTKKVKIGARVGAMALRKTTKYNLVSKKAKQRMLLQLGVDSVPGLGILPLSTIAVIYAWRKSSKQAEQHKIELKDAEQATKHLENTLATA